MIPLILTLFAGAGLLVLIFRLLRSKPGAAEGSAKDFVEARHSLRSLQLGLLAPELIDRIFAREDLNYVTSAAPRAVQDLFLSERKRITLTWIRRVREQISNLRDFHSRRSRSYANLSIASELKLAVDFVDLQARCRALEFMVHLRGPYAAQRMIEKTAASAEGLCAIVGESLAFLTPSSPERMTLAVVARPTGNESEQ